MLISYILFIVAFLLWCEKSQKMLKETVV